MKQVHVVGGGLAGAAAAWELAKAGRPVILWESRAALGGRVCGITDPETGLELDNGQHVQLGACTVSRRLFSAWNIPLRWQERSAVTYADERRETGTIRESLLPAPFHMSPSFLTYPLLGFSEKCSIARTFLRVLTLTENERTALDDVSFAEWLGPVPSRARTLFWDPIVEATLNGPLEMSSAAIALLVIRDGFLLDKAGARIGILEGTQGAN